VADLQIGALGFLGPCRDGLMLAPAGRPAVILKAEPRRLEGLNPKSTTNLTPSAGGAKQLSPARKHWVSRQPHITSAPEVRHIFFFPLYVIPTTNLAGQLVV
jgi:hypothetical protein